MTLKELKHSRVTFKLILELREELKHRADHNILTLQWDSGHTGFTGNGKADELARQRSLTTFSAKYIQ